VEDLDLDVVVADDDSFGDVLDQFSLLVSGKIGPTGSEVLGIGYYLVAREMLDAEEVELALESWDLVLDLLEPLFHRPVLAAEPVFRDLV